jgi:protein TonB
MRTHPPRLADRTASDVYEIQVADHEDTLASSVNIRSSEGLGYAPSGKNRVIGIAGTFLIYALLALSSLLTVHHVTSSPTPGPVLSVVDVRPPTSLPEAPPEELALSEPIEEQWQEPKPAEVQLVDRQIPAITSTPMPAAVQPTNAPQPHPRQEDMTPKAAPAPPAPQASTTSPNTWEGRVLAELNKHRRYPRTAQARRQQGVPYIRFVIDREGNVLSVRLERSSGVAVLDHEAVALPKRAQPLPKPPEDRPGDTIELVAPVEFFLR